MGGRRLAFLPSLSCCIRTTPRAGGQGSDLPSEAPAASVDIQTPVNALLSGGSSHDMLSATLPGLSAASPKDAFVHPESRPPLPLLCFPETCT